jgi:transposase
VATEPDSFSQWLRDASIREAALSTEQRAVLLAAFRFRQSQGSDYYSTRLLSHFLLHCGCGLKVAQIARLLRISRPTASKQQALSSKEAIQQAHHRMDGRPYGKLLPRFAGPIAQFLLTNPQATRYDLIDFIDRTFGVRVSRIALHHFLKKYGLEAIPHPTDAAPPVPPARPAPAAAPAPAGSPAVVEVVLPATPPPPPFSSDALSLRVLSCC